MAQRADKLRVRAAQAAASEGPVGSGNGHGNGRGVAASQSSAEAQLLALLGALEALGRGDAEVRLPARRNGLEGQTARAFNRVAELSGRFTNDLERVAKVVGREGRMGERVSVGPVEGSWRNGAESVNRLIDDLVRPTTEVARVLEAVAKGDLGQKMALNIAGQPVKGEFQRIGTVVNTMVDQLSAFADEVTRVASEVGTEGKLGGQAQVKNVSGTWKSLTDSVNQLAGNLTSQVRNIAQVTTAVARGDLTQRITVDARGEILELKSTINIMVDQLSAFAAEVTRVAREVGTEGRLGGQAEVEGVSGTWKRLTENVNQLAGNLTTQVRAIAEVSAAVTQGDLTRSITVEAPGEVGELKDTINQMIANLAETTRLNTDQDWLKSNLARISAMLQGQRDLRAVSRLIMSELTPLVSAQHGAFYLAEGEGDDLTFRLVASYGYKHRKGVANSFKEGESLVGQAVLEKKAILITEAPSDYIRVSSGLGETAPVNVVVLPVVFEDQVLAVTELASVHPFSETNQAFLEQIVETVGVVVSTILANMRTESLLQQSQGLTYELQSQSEELQAQQDELRRSNLELEQQAQSLKASEEMLQSQQEELRKTNEELEQKASQLATQNQAIEVKNREIELARQAIEERAEQLTVSSRYKSEFLANMSHELRTPLNSLLVLAKLLADNRDENLTEKQVEFARNISNAGHDLLNLISDILDLSKIEAGKLEISSERLDLAEVAASLQETFIPLADQKGLALDIRVEDEVPGGLLTDPQRLQQVLNNLLSNAIKFTHEGGVTVVMGLRRGLAPFASETLNSEEGVVVFEVTDTGIGIAEEHLMSIFEAFQQADGSTSRRYGGTGLGLSISREIARILGGEIHVRSRPGEGSTFTLFLSPRHLVRPDQEPLPAVLSATTPSALGTGVTDAHVQGEVPEDRPDDRHEIEPGDRVLLIVAEEEHLLISGESAGRAAGFKILIATRGDSALALATTHGPDAIVLDTGLHGVDGLALLEELKRLPSTRHIPVHVISSAEQRTSALSAGAVAYLEKPATADDVAGAVSRLVGFIETPGRRLLVVEDDARERAAIIELVGGDDVEVVGAASSDEALEALGNRRFDCMVLDLKLPRTGGFALLEQVKSDEAYANMPVVVYTGKELTRREETRLKKYAETIIVKDARSPERLLDETALFLHRVESRMPVEKRRIIEQLHSADAVFAGRTVLIVDDDVRNVFALTSAFEGRGMRVLFGENGREGIEALEGATDGVDLVLMDIMMPEMDGYAAMRAIRQEERFRELPIIALTAKAMKGDREECIAAGASDYITKPVDIDQLLSLMRVWLYR